MICEAKPEWEEPKFGIEVKRYVLCPHCEKGKVFYDYAFESLHLPTTVGPTHCGECGGTFMVRIGKLVDDKAEIVVMKEDRKVTKGLALLVRGNMLLVVKHTDYGHGTDDAYWYNQHTCPTNYLRDAAVVMLRPDEKHKHPNADPHGLFTFVTRAEYKDLMNTSYEDVLAHFGVSEENINATDQSIS